MTYIDAFHDKQKDKIYIVERVNGKRIFQEFSVPYSFYYEDENGTHTSIFGHKLRLFTTTSNKIFRKELAKYQKSNKETFESDIKPIFKLLEKEYTESTAPNLNVCFFDIEVSFDKEYGHAEPSNPFNYITAISLYNSWEEELYTITIKPEKLSNSVAKNICDKFENCYLVEDEATLLMLFLELIEDADVLTGWNSDAYDIPYIVGRIYRVLNGDYARKLCFWNQKPAKKTFLKFGKENLSYTLIGRIHIDYLELYKKYTYHQMLSYSLDYVGEVEVQERKVAYEGTLDQLYNEDYEKFIEYSRQDVMVMVKIDNKLDFISLANQLAHDNGVLIPTTMGAVALTDQAIIRAIHDEGLVAPDRSTNDDEIEYDYEENDLSGFEEESRKKGYTLNEAKELLKTTIAGAYVATPKRGLHDWVGSIDLNSLYPSAMRALNISPETILGQIDQTETNSMLLEGLVSKKMTFTECWNNRFNILEFDRLINRGPEKLKLKFDETGEEHEMSCRELYQTIFNNQISVSANGTLFDQTKEGIIPKLLSKWYSDRKIMQAKKREYDEKAKEENKKGNDSKKFEEEANFWDQRQLIKKIQLNSLYGAVTNAGSRFFDQRMGQSITLTGRSIARHMAAKVNEILTKEYDHVGKCIVYGDTDSVYFSAEPVKDEWIQEGLNWNVDNIISLYDEISESVNETFLPFMVERFNATSDRAKVIKAGREIVAAKAIFVKKKRYAAMVVDDEGNRLDVDGKPGKLKIMGMDTQRSDSPTYIQNFLKNLLYEILSGTQREEIIQYIREFRKEFRTYDPWNMGAPTAVNKLFYYSNLEDAQGKANLPGHVRAAYNYNKLRKAYGDNYSLEIMDGMKVYVCKLKSNPLNISSIAVPVDESRIPNWFKELPFDIDAMEKVLIDSKLEKTIGVLNWNLQESKQNENIIDLFDMA